MSASESLTWPTCRLCGLPCQQSIHIFDRLACVNLLHYKIKQLLDIAIGRSDNLPHSVCLLCVNKLDSFWCFKNTCHQVQIKLRKMGGLNRSNDANCNRLQPISGPSIMVTSDFNNSSTTRPSHHEKELDLQSPSTSADFFGKKEIFEECSDDVSKQQSTFTNIDSDSIPLAVDYHNQLGEETIHGGSHLHSGNASISNDSETTLIHTRGVDNCISDDEGDDYNGNIEEDNSMSIASEESVNVECIVDISSYDITLHASSTLGESTGQTSADSNCQEMYESTSVCEDEENFEMNSSSITKMTEDNIFSNSSSNAQEQNDENTGISSLSATTGSEIAHFFKGHFYRMDTNNNSDLLCNRIPYLLVESKMGTKHMIYTISPDLSKFDNDHNYYMLDTDLTYLALETFDLENPNVIRTLIEWLSNLLKGEISLMPYYFGWLDSKNQLNLSFKCVLCKRCIDGNRQMIMNHIADHLLWICPVCGRFCRCLTQLSHHLLKHESPTFECSTCGENLGNDFERFKVHKRGHYKFECFSCRFECFDEEKWLKHLTEDRKNVEFCSSDCCLFYENIDEFRNHVSKLETVGGYVCGACGMAYHCEEYLKLHVRVHGIEHGSKICDAVLPASAGSEIEVTNVQKKLDHLKYSNELTHFDTLKKILDNEIDFKEFQTSSAARGRVFAGFTCFKCNQILQSEKKFRIHIENHLMMTCCQCKRYFKGIGRLRNHFQICSFKRRMCVGCRSDFWLNTSEEYLEHLSLHQKRRICIYCQDVLPSHMKLQRHIDTLHSAGNDKHWFCELCNETLVVSYKSLESFKLNHFKERHPDKLESFICEICGKTYISKNLLVAHTKNKHLAKINNDTFICAYCSKEFRRKQTLGIHVQQHMNEKNYKCDICEKAFNRVSSLYKHQLDMHSVKKHVCNFCEKRFSYPSALRDHMKRAHTCERSVRSKSSANSSHSLSTGNPFQD